METSKTLTLAVASERVGFVYLENERLVDWGFSTAAVKSTKQASEFLKKRTRLYQPDTIVIEIISRSSRKGQRSRAVTNHFANLTRRTNSKLVRVVRTQAHDNKYLEAASLAEYYPSLRTAVPTKPPIWEKEPLQTVVFEALSLALTSFTD